MIQGGTAANVGVRVVLLHGPLDGLKVMVPNSNERVYFCNVGGFPNSAVLFKVPETYRDRLWDVGVYGLPEHAYQSHGFWVLQWLGWAGNRP